MIHFYRNKKSGSLISDEWPTWFVSDIEWCYNEKKFHLGGGMVMNYTSAEAAKLLRKLNEEQAAMKEKEEKCAVFVASGEDVESVRPAYDYDTIQDKLLEIENQVRLVKHAINVFNTTTKVPGFEMTVDQMLVYIPQLNERKRKLAQMAGRLPKERLAASGYGAKSIVEYQYANYDVEKAEEDLAAVTDELARAQTALDVLNNSLELEIDL